MSSLRAMGTSLTKKKNGSETADWVIGSLNSIGEIGGAATEIDVTTLDSPGGAKEFISGDMDFGELAVAGYIKKEEDEQTAVKMMALLQSGSVENWDITFPSTAKWAFTGFVKSFKTTAETPDGLIGFNASIKISGLPVYTPKNV
ncbi:MAG: hypothetical protein FWF46_07555 [Oscillospiraceae bacterium]|nr:hypothetical protein [Oscillospiraceae bacterium]